MPKSFHSSALLLRASLCGALSAGVSGWPGSSASGIGRLLGGTLAEGTAAAGEASWIGAGWGPLSGGALADRCRRGLLLLARRPGSAPVGGGCWAAPWLIAGGEDCCC